MKIGVSSRNLLDTPIPFYLVRVVGVEPTRLAAQEPKSCASANSAIPAYSALYLTTRRRRCQRGAFSRRGHRIRRISASFLPFPAALIGEFYRKSAEKQFFVVTAGMRRYNNCIFDTMTLFSGGLPFGMAAEWA